MTRRRPSAAPRFRVADGVAHREIEGQTLLMCAGEDGLLTLNATGQFIWQRVVTQTKTDTIVAAFQRRFGIAASDARQDVTRFLAMLERRRLIVRA